MRVPPFSFIPPPMLIWAYLLTQSSESLTVAPTRSKRHPNSSKRSRARTGTGPSKPPGTKAETVRPSSPLLAPSDLPPPFTDSDLPPTSQRRTAASRTRSRSGSFTSDRPHSIHSRSFPSHSDSDSEPDDSTHHPPPYPSSGHRPLSSSLLLAAGSSDPVVLLYDLSREGRSAGVRRLEGHKDSVYAVDFLQAGGREGREGGDGEGQGGYGGHGLLASGGADCVVKVWKPVFAEVE